MKTLDMFFGDRFHKGMFLFFSIAAVGLIITSFFIPPLAVIDGSVIAAVGEIFAFAALGQVVAAIDRGNKATVTHNNTSITIGNDEQISPINEEITEEVE